MGFLVVNLLLQFYSRKIFLEYLGTEVLGLNTTAQNILQFLNLAELGINTAVGFSLYKPLADGDRQAINEIVALQGHLYRRIATGIIAGAVAVSLFFPWIFGKIQLPLWYAYGSFGALLLSSLLGYFVNFRQVVLTSAQMDYKVQYSLNSWTAVKISAQIAALSLLSHPYEWWLALEVIFAIISAMTLRHVTRRNFPYLDGRGMAYSELKVKYRVIITKIKQLFVHRIGSFALSNTSTLVIYATSTLTEVALYGNYIIIITGITRVSQAIFNMGASIGNLVAEGDTDHIFSVFRELQSMRYVFALVTVFGVMTCCQPLICLWIGEQYLLPDSTLAIIAATLFINMSRSTVDQFLNAYGLFSDIWAPVVEAAINIGLSILLGILFGLNGILCGVFVSLLVVISGWKPFFLFSRGFHRSLWWFWRDTALHVALAFVTGIAVWRYVGPLLPDPYAGWGNLVCYTLLIAAIFTVALCLLLCSVRAGILAFFKRMTGMATRH